MIGKKPNWYWRICWGLLSPLVVGTLTILSFTSGTVYMMDDYVYPIGFQILGHLASAFPISLIVLIFAFKYCSEGGWMVRF